MLQDGTIEAIVARHVWFIDLNEIFDNEKRNIY